MARGGIFGLLTGLSLGLGLSWVTPLNAQSGVRFHQDRFAIGFWVAPQTDENVEARYAEIAEANFNFVIGLCGAKSPPPAAQQLAWCEKYGLKALIPWSPGAEPVPDGPAVWGYTLRDEPSAKQFGELGQAVANVRAAHPGKLGYINLFPNYASREQLGTETYEEHVKRFVAEVGPDVLSMDHYPQFHPHKDGREAYCTNLDVFRRHARAAGIPFWNFFNTMPYGPHTDPTEAQLRWQVYASLAYGARGVMYFCYWTPRGDEFPKGGAILTADGRRTRHYDEAKRINAALKNLGPTLMQLESLGAQRVSGPKPDVSSLPGTPVRSITEGDYLIGSFRHADGRRAVLIQNYHFAFSAWPTVTFDAAAGVVLEVSPKTGRLQPVVDDSPDMAGLQVSLDAGEGRLFVLPAP